MWESMNQGVVYLLFDATLSLPYKGSLTGFTKVLKGYGDLQKCKSKSSQQIVQSSPSDLEFVLTD